MSRWLADLTPLRASANFRRLWWGLGLANIGAQLTVLAVGLQVYALTKSTFAVGLLGLAALVPLLVMGLYGGALADTHDRRQVALVASSVIWLAVLGLVFQAWVGNDNVLWLYLLVAVESGASAVNSPARGAIIPRLLPADLLPAANALNMMTHTIAMTAGPLLGAFLVRFAGFGWTYLIDAVTFTAALYAVIRLPKIPPQTTPKAPDAVRLEDRPQTAGVGLPEADVVGQIPGQPHSVPPIPTQPSPPPHGWRAVADGLRFLSTAPNLRMTFLIDMAAMILAYPRVLFPAVAALVIGGGATTVGILTASIAAGSALAAVFSGPVARVRFQGRVIAWAVAAWGLGISLFGLVVVLAQQSRTSPTGAGDTEPILWWAVIAAGVALAAAGGADSTSAVLRGTILQVAAPDSLRGRLQGVFIVVVAGGPRLGEMVAGTEATAVGEGWAAVIGGLVCIVAVAALMRWQRGFASYDAFNPTP